MTESYEPNVVLATKEFDVVGTRPVRHDGADKVTGRALYGADFYTAGLLYGKLLRSPHAHARIKSIDTSRAEAMEGVRAVVTAADLPDGPPFRIDLGEGGVSVKYLRHNVLAHDKALYVGHAVAGVAAVSADIAEEALDLIEVDYEALPATMSALESLEDGAPALLDDLRQENGSEDTDGRANLAKRILFTLGDVDKGFEQADMVVEREFNTSTVHQGYIEPQNVTAHWNSDGRLTLWTSTQGAFFVRDSAAAILARPVSQVKVVPMEIGGGFGGKFPLYAEPVAALLSAKTGQAVKIVLTRQEVFEGTGPTCASNVKVKIGATNDGKITAASARLAFEAGAFPGSPVPYASMAILWAYDIPNVTVEGLDVLVNKPKTGAYRAPGSPNACFSSESVIDELAQGLGIDPIEFRLLNASRAGARRADGPRHGSIGVVEALEAMKDHPHWGSTLAGPNRGRGVSLGLHYHIGLQSSCTLSVNGDGTVNLVEGSTDIGGTRTAVAMQAAEVLGIAAEDVLPTVADTDSIGFTFGTGGSRTAFATGWAAYEAALDVERQMIARAASIWDADSDSIELTGGVFRSKHDPELSMTFKELAGLLNETGGPVTGRATVNPSGVGGSAVGNIVDVEVDPETGKVDILRYTVVQDAGKAIHPGYVEGQMQGGTVQGIGWALNEEYFFDESGRMLNSSLLDYRMPITMDLPMIDTVIVEVPNPGHPYGARGLGEGSIVTPPGALGNAIHDATGLRMDTLPMNPVAITRGLLSKRTGKAAT